MIGRFRPRSYLVALVLAFAVGMFVLFLVMNREQKEQSASTFEASDAAVIQEAFNSRDPRDLAKVISARSENDVADIARETIPQGSRLIILPESFRLLGTGLGILEGRVEGERPGSFEILVHQRGARWLVVSTSEPRP